jgi:hypothetical protein
MEPDYVEEDEDELDNFTDQLYNQLEITGVHPLIEETLKARLKRRLARLDVDQQLRLLMHLR